MDQDIDVFNDNEAEEQETEAETVVEGTEETEVEAKAETEETEETEEEPTSSDDKDEVSGLKKALKAERQKRQDAQSKLRKQEEAPKTVPDPVTDPEGYAAYHEQSTERKVLNDRIVLTQDLMRDLHEDFDKYQGIFMNLVSKENDDGSLSITDPALLQKFNASANPAKFAYNHAKKHEEIEALSSPDYKENLRKSIEAEVLQKLKAKGLAVADLPNLTNAAASNKNDVIVDDKSKDVIDVFDD
jgi:hypothetical protein